MRRALLALGFTSLLLLACGSDDSDGTTDPGKIYPTEVLASLAGFDANGPSPSGIALDDTHVYVSVVNGNAETGSIIRIPKTGGNVESVVTGVGSSKILTIADATIYFDDDTHGAIRSVPKGGGDVFDVTTESGATDLVVSGDRVLFANSAIGKAGVVGSVATSGGEVTPLIESSERPVGIAVQAETAYAALLGPGNSAGGEGSIVGVPLAGGPTVPLVQFLSAPRALVIEGDVLYATLQGAESSDGAVVAVTLDSGVIKNLANWRKKPWGLATDSTFVYWVNRGESGDGTVMKVAKAGGVPTILADKQGEPRQIAADATHVYWTNFLTGEIMRVAK